MKKRLILTFIFLTFFALCATFSSFAYCDDLLTPGDANGDGSVNVKDAMLILKHTAAWDVDIHSGNADALKDDKVNVKDAMLIIKVSAGWKNVRLGHNDEISVKTEPTCTVPGVSQMKCTRCGHTHLFETSPLYHTYRDGICIFCNGITDDEEERIHKSSNGLIFELLPDATYSVRASDSFTDEVLIIPDELNGIPVTCIPDYAFLNRSQLTTVYVCQTVTHIGPGAFESCDNIEYIQIPFVGENADGTGKTHFGHIFGTPDSSIDVHKIPKIKNVYIMGGKAIGESAFQGMSSLESVELGSSIEKIGEMAFTNCSGLTKIGFARGGALTEIGDSAFYGCSRLTELVLPEGLKKIGKGAFMCKSLESVTLPSSLIRIRGGAFNYCNDLKTVNISDISAWFNIVFETSASNPATLAEALYLNGKLITELVIPEGVTTISSYAFENNKALCSVSIPHTVSRIGEDAFKDTIGLTDLHIQSLEAWCATELESSGSVPGSQLYLNGELVTELIIPEGVTGIPAHAFVKMKSITSVVIPDSVTYIGNGAFRGCAELTSAILPAGISQIPDQLFSYCSKLEGIIIPENVVSIGENVFYSCTALREIVIPAKVTFLGKSCFKDCTSLAYALFEVTQGWSCGTYDILSGYLAKATKAEENAFYGNAIEYLTEKYTFNDWTRK